MDRQVITVDGLAGSGKSALAVELARRLGFVHFHTGAFYRGVGLLGYRCNVALEDGPGLAGLTVAVRALRSVV